MSLSLHVYIHVFVLLLPFGAHLKWNLYRTWKVSEMSRPGSQSKRHVNFSYWQQVYIRYGRFALPSSANARQMRCTNARLRLQNPQTKRIRGTRVGTRPKRRCFEQTYVHFNGRRKGTGARGGHADAEFSTRG